MKSTARIKEWRERSAESLENLLKAFKEKLQSLRFLAAQGKLKNVRELRTIKQDVARLETIIKQKKD